jgi:hypothetical protein
MVKLVVGLLDLVGLGRVSRVIRFSGVTMVTKRSSFRSVKCVGRAHLCGSGTS